MLTGLSTLKLLHNGLLGALVASAVPMPISSISPLHAVVKVDTNQPTVTGSVSSEKSPAAVPSPLQLFDVSAATDSAAQVMVSNNLTTDAQRVVTNKKKPMKSQLLLNLDSHGKEDTRPGVYAFPGASGHGKHAAGGRGGRVFCINTLEDINIKGDGLISYREAISGINEADTLSRIVTFCVSGEINTGIRNPVRIERGNLTVACQSAPSPGVVITGYRPISVNTGVQDIVWRHCDVKLRDTLDPSRNMTNRGVAIGGRSDGAPNRLMFDHMSIMWSTDDSFSIHVNRSTERKVPRNITLMHSIVGEGDTTCRRQDGECGNAASKRKQTGDYRYPNHSTGPQVSSLNGTQIGGISYIANVFANTVSRNPQIRGAYGEVVNNFVFNMYGDGTRASASAGRRTLNDIYIENNIYKQGPDTGLHKDHLIYKDGNYVVHGNTVIRRNGTVFRNYKSNAIKRLVHPREYLGGNNKLDLSCVGASRPFRDSADRRIIKESGGLGTNKVSTSAEIGIGPRVEPIIGPCKEGEKCFYEGTVDDQGQRDYSDYATVRKHDSDYDTDQDGIADEWELKLIDSDKTDALESLADIDHSTDADNDGYLDVEEWLNSLARCK